MIPHPLLAVLAALLALPSGQQEPTGSARRLGIPRPGMDGGPTEVRVGIYVIDLSRIESADQQFTADFLLNARWRDERLAGGEPRVIGPDEAWVPRLQVANELRLFRRLPEELTVDAEGDVTYRQRFVGTLTAPVYLGSFPFDEHVFAIRLVGAADDVRGLRLAPNPERTGQAEQLSVPDWAIEQGAPRVTTYVYPPTGAELPELRYELPVRRLTTFYVWKLLLPLSLIVVMSWTVFWIDPQHLGPRLSVGVTSMLTVIAYRFVLGQYLPRLPYLTRLDSYSLGCTLLVLLALIQVVVCANIGREESARRLNRACRVGFPLVLLAALGASVWL